MYVCLALYGAHKDDTMLPGGYGGKNPVYKLHFHLPLCPQNVRIFPQRKEGLENMLILHSFPF